MVRRAWARLRRDLPEAPASQVYLVTAAATWWTLLGVDPRAAHRLLVRQSTNLANMRTHPFRVLVASAFWIDGTGEFLLVVLAFLVVMVPAERWLGTRRWVVAFATGHVGASLLTVAGIALALRSGAVDARVTHAADVGVSYGFVAVAAVCTGGSADPRVRAAWTAALVTVLAVAAVTRRTFTDVGHLAAGAIGLGLRRGLGVTRRA